MIERDSQASPATRSSELWEGARDTLPLIVGAIPFGIIFGAAATAGGISPAATAAMSAFVFAGSAQFVAVGLVTGGAGFVVVVATTFVINLRHLLYAATLAPQVKHLPQRWLIPLGFWLTDETFLVVIKRYIQQDNSPFKHWYFLGSAIFMYTSWQICTYLGMWAGRSIPNPHTWGLEFALPVTFIGMLVPLVENYKTGACIVAAALAALLFHELPGQLGLVIAVAIGVFRGLVC